MELGEMIDKLYELRETRLELDRTVADLKSQEVAARLMIKEKLEEVGLAKASGKRATCGITSKIEPIIEDWDKVHDFIRTENRFDLLQKRLSAPAWRELQENNILVPGTESVVVFDVSLTKSTR
jgi:hypothetical protein